MKKSQLAVTLTASALAMTESGCGVAGAPKDTAHNNSRQMAPTEATAAKWAALSRMEMRGLLTAIEQAKEPEPQMGAMCYSPFFAPAQLDYICPQCGEKTKYADDGRFDMAEMVRCRAVFQRIPRHEAMALDESEFCRNCQPHDTAPQFRLILRFDDGTTCITTGVTLADIQLLEAALKGEKAVDGPASEVKSVCSQLPRLRELLGEKAKP